MVGTLDQQAATMVSELRKHFDEGVTRPYKWRLEQAKAILTMMKTHYNEFIEAGAKDFNKPELETDISEVAMVEHEVKHTIAKLSEWMAPETVPTPAWLAPATSEVRRDPYGVVLIIAPFNYPLQLAVCPVVNALAAGNVVVLKPSELTPNVSKLLTKLLPAYLDRRAIRIMEGGIPETTALLNQRWDLIFFTGSETVGRIVHQAAAKHLTPCVLELGGKSPVIIDDTVADLELAARRIIWGKLMNAGQTCIAPDYILCHKKVHDKFLEYAKNEIRSMFGEDPRQSKDLARIVSERHAQRLKALLDDKPGKVECGGDVDLKERYVAPTLISGVKPDSKIMKEEIFGPLLPVMSVSSVDEAINIIRDHPNPLALYVFSHRRDVCDHVIASVPSGGVCLNDCVVHFCASSLPFGGVGGSGLGHCHGKYSFEAFTHARGVMRRWDNRIGDIPLRYPPYSKTKHAIFRSLIDSLVGVTCPSTFKAAIEQGVRTLVFGLGVYQLLLLAFTLYKAHLA